MAGRAEVGPSPSVLHMSHKYTNECGKPTSGCAGRRGRGGKGNSHLVSWGTVISWCCAFVASLANAHHGPPAFALGRACDGPCCDRCRYSGMH